MKLIPMLITEMKDWFYPVEEQLLSFIGACAGEAYNSNMDKDACIKRALNCVHRGHHSVFEHASITLKCTVDRGVSHALVRHRHCAFTQSSTIYQKFQEIEVIETTATPEETKKLYALCELEYQRRLNSGMAPSEARDVLPTCLATNLIITTNIRQWMYEIQRRCGPGDSEKMHYWNKLVREWFENIYPVTLAAFDAWYEEHPL